VIRLRIATLNTWGLPWPISRPTRAGRYRHIARYLRDAAFDIAGLQEVWRGAPKLDVHGVHQAPDGGLSGLAVVTPFRVVETRFCGYGKRRWMPWVEKGALHMRLVNAAGLEVDVFNTHLQAYRGANDARMRRQQIDTLLEMSSSTRGPAILMGDFNLYEGIAADRASTSQILGAGFRDAIGDQPPTPTYVFPDEAERFDRIFIRDGGGVRVEVESHHVEHYQLGRRRLPFLSDHLPVEATLKLS
jgi:endonuclease/exonuclease/phosphatase family metal-dependent hydrolase